MSIEARLARVFRDSLELAPDCVVSELTYRSVPQWDSVGHMRLVAALETEFDLLLETEEIIDLSSFPKALEILATHGLETV
jgi:acyl carrier protein